MFGRVNLYLARLHEVNEIIRAANDFSKLEKIQLGGVRGRYLTQRIQNVHTEFQMLYNVCIANSSNCLEPLNEQFKCLKRNFLAKITILERKLSQIFIESLEHCNGIESNVRLLEMIGALLQRPIIKYQLSRQLDTVIKNFQNELNTIEMLMKGNEQSLGTKVMFCFSAALQINY